MSVYETEDKKTNNIKMKNKTVPKSISTDVV